MEKTIDLGCGYRLKRLDARNWKMQHWHVSERGSAKAGDEPAWYDAIAEAKSIRDSIVAAAEAVTL